MEFSNEENIHEGESTLTLPEKEIKLNMCIHNIHLHIFHQAYFASNRTLNFKENDNTLKFAKHVSTETSVIFN